MGAVHARVQEGRPQLDLAISTFAGRQQRQRAIESELEVAVDHHPRGTEDAPQKVLVAEASLESAQHAIEALTEPEELVDGT